MTWLARTINETDTLSGRLSDAGTQLLIVVSLAAYAVETLPDLSPAAKARLQTIEVISVGLFTAEYLLRLAVSPSRIGYVTSFFGVIDLLAILPFLLSFGVDLRSLRAFRLLRLFRVLKMARYSEAVGRLHLALRIAREELVLFGGMTAIVLFLAAVGIHYFEHEAQPAAFASVFHSFWWAVVTLTTVGYGDAYPITAGGRLFTLAILLVGLGIVSIPPGLIASALSRAREIQREEKEQDHEPPQGATQK